ncbi:MAG: PorT family protein [Bacteroidetes bacterium]|nr:PorT family protein [Bacteroidota bacterium]MCL2302088.1 PorT family protein [Lentimicrobiaceae bacterium]
MKKLTCIILGLLITVGAMAQESSVTKKNVRRSCKFTFGPEVIFHTGKIAFDENIIKNFESGFDVGLFARMGGRVYFEPSVLYSFKKIDFSSMDSLKGSFKDHFLTVPLLLGVKVIDRKQFNLRIFAGPQFGFSVARKYEDAKDFFDSAEIGVYAGVGVDIWRFTMNVGYNFSTSKHRIMENRTKQNMFFAGVGFKFIN